MSCVLADPLPWADLLALVAKWRAETQPQPEAPQELIDAAQAVVGYADLRDDGMQGAGQMLGEAIDRLRAVLAAKGKP